MNIKELRGLNEAQLNKHLATLREQVRDLRFRVSSKEVKNNHQLSEIKREIARCLTIINEPAK